MSTKHWIGIATILFIILILLALALFLVPVPVHAPTASVQEPTSTTPTSTTPSAQPLHDKVTVSTPASGQTIAGHALTIKGEAPGNWYFEASFPIKVTTPQGDTIGTGHATAQSDWMTTGQVPFTATIALNMAYSGPATVALLRDNPSGLPENDDSLSIPIVIQ